MHRFANPARFLRIANLVLPWSSGVAVLALGAGLYTGLVLAPADYQQGETVRIMFVHVPSAWMALFIYTAMAVASAASLIWKHLGYMALWQAFDDEIHAAKAAAILALVGFVNVPIIKFSVDWWNTLHQPASVLRLDGPAIHSSMLVPLLLMTLGFKAYFVTLLILRVRSEVAARKVHNRRLAEVRR